jgi:hypothetical protein
MVLCILPYARIRTSVQHYCTWSSQSILTGPNLTKRNQISPNRSGAHTRHHLDSENTRNSQHNWEPHAHTKICGKKTRSHVTDVSRQYVTWSPEILDTHHFATFKLQYLLNRVRPDRKMKIFQFWTRGIEESIPWKNLENRSHYRKLQFSPTGAMEWWI